MTSSLPQEAREVFERYITTEYATMDALQQPIVWPVTPYYSQGAASIDVTTGIGYPKKADDAKRNPHVALLFSDPTGSRIESGIQVLVQGTAEVDESDLAANRERYRREALVKLPATKEMLPPRFLEGLFGWYFDRIYVKTRPERVFVWPSGDITTPPEVYDSHVEEVRLGHAEESLEPLEPAAGGPTAWDARIEELGVRHKTAVLSWAAPDGFPLAVRVPVTLDRDSRRIQIGAEPVGLPVAEGRACLVAHAHAPDFKWQENFQVRGDLVRDGEALSLVPHKLIGGFELPKESRIAGLRRNFGKARRYHRIAKERRAAPQRSA
jgi:pyridoxamine 5'-phosphate oxidase-like protein